MLGGVITNGHIIIDGIAIREVKTNDFKYYIPPLNIKNCILHAATVASYSGSRKLK